MYGNTFPSVVKIGSAHASAGKSLIEDHYQMPDMESVLAMMSHQYCLVEPFIEGVGDLRIQKIESHLRAFRRINISGERKTNTDTSMMKGVSIEPRWVVWVNHVKSMFGGLDILTMQLLLKRVLGESTYSK
jgi:hypothetical protein